MERLRPRLLKTYAGPRGGRRKAGGGQAGLRRVGAAAPWISPQVDRRRYFSSTSSSGGASSPSSLGDPDFLPPSSTRRRRRRKKGAKENRAPPKGRRAEDCRLPTTPLCKNVTQRPRRANLRLRPPLVCSTPQQPLATEKQNPVEGSPAGHRFSAACRCCSPQTKRESLRDNSGAFRDVLPELSLLNMDGDGEVQAATGSLELFTHEDAGSLLCQHPFLGPQVQTPSVAKSHSSCVHFQSHCAVLSHSLCSKTEAPLKSWGGVAVSPNKAASPPSEAGYLPDADQDHSPKTSVPPKTPMTSQRPLQGACQLQVSVRDGKVALSLPKGTEALDNKRQRMSVEAGITPYKKVGGLNGVLLDQRSDFSLAENSPQLQPVVILDNQVVPNWLANKCSEKKVVGLLRKKEHGLPSDSPCAVPGVSDTTSSSQVVPTCGEGATGRKACISGFSSKRWGQQGKLGQARRKKNTGWKERADASLLQDHLKWNEMEDNLAFSSFPDGSSVKNSSLWRRIRASLSLHKKKKILSEVESFNSTELSISSPSSLHARMPKTSFTKTLGYSICPSSSMVLLSSMNSFSIAEVILTDAEKVYGECQQEGPISFEECIPPEKMQKCEKIGEGVFGEVFKTEGEKGAVALKIIPIEGNTKVNGEAQKTFSEILPEIIISKELSLLAEEADNQTPGFISLYSVHCVRGAYPEHLLKAWDEYDRLRESENDRPDFFGDQQLFMVLEFVFGGTDLENMRNRQLSSVTVAKSILHQVTASLAVAEEALQFEHRDLHWGNVLIKKATVKELTFKLRGESRTLPTQGVLVNIIDYTFSRLEKDGLTVYCDLSTDEEVFQGRGDYQFDIYRQMREENSNSWADYFPHSNILWLHYLADKLLKEVSYKKKPTSPSMRQAQKQLELFCKQILGFCSATELLNTSTFFH
ncbi:serine/threonine-protein kinase haspin [Heteronotia binoei]|uniref:serine/threonine-protein kinase haspin n=1 Tax=Heteronotia binoei TaxID=13085 RepID=UPI00292FFA17|nr:serine/threonine-protein kinase haspin [Heteronotia binoei]